MMDKLQELVLILRNDADLYKAVSPRLRRMSDFIKAGTWRKSSGFLSFSARENVGSHIRGTYANCALAQEYDSKTRYAAAQECFDYWETEMEQFGNYH